MKKYLVEFIGMFLFVLTLGMVVIGPGIGSVLMVLFASTIFPNLIYSLSNPENNLTIYNVASLPKTLGIILVIACIGVPVVIAYTVYIYWIFRGKVKLDKLSY